MEGQIIKGYLFEDELGHGSFGEVYKVTKDGKTYAAKAIRTNTKAGNKTAEMEEAFANNIRLQCPFLVKYFDTFRNPKNTIVFVVMEFCEKSDLEDLIAKLDPEDGILLHEPRLMKIIIQLLLAIYELHHNKMLHRDIKAGNAFINAQNDVKIGDYGCGVVLEGTMDQASTFTGTLQYISPEIFRGLKYSYAADVWSLGVLIYYLTTAKMPFGKDTFQVPERVKKGEFEHIGEETCASELSAVIDSMLRVEPTERATLLEILSNPYIQKFAKKLDLIKFFPSEVLSADMQNDPKAAVLTYISPTRSQPGSTPSASPGSYPTASSNNSLSGSQVGTDVAEFITMTVRRNPTISKAEFRADFEETLNRKPSLAEINMYLRTAEQLSTDAKPTQSVSTNAPAPAPEPTPPPAAALPSTEQSLNAPKSAATPPPSMPDTKHTAAASTSASQSSPNIPSAGVSQPSSSPTTLLSEPAPAPYRSARWARRGPSPPPPDRNSASTLWFEKGQTFDEALARRARESIRAMGGAVECRVYGGVQNHSTLPNLEYADLREAGWREIKYMGFDMLRKLSRVEFPPELEIISSFAFANDVALSEVLFPEKLKTIESNAFDNCSGLKEVVLPPGFETLEQSSFSYCTSLRRVELPPAMKLISGYSFKNCEKLETLVVGDVKTWLEYVKEGYTMLEGVKAVKELRLIGQQWETLPQKYLATCLAKNARVVGVNFVGQKLVSGFFGPKFTVVAN